MKSYWRMWLVILGVLLCAAPIAAQEADAAPTGQTDDGQLGRILVELGWWIPQPLGANYSPATRSNPTNVFDTTILEMPVGTQGRPRVRAGFLFRDNIGEFVLTYWSQADANSLDVFDPGNFRFGELPVFPLYAGVFDDGLADAVLSEAVTSTRDLRLDFYRLAFEGPRVKGRWFVGVRRVFHQRRFDGSYFGLVPNLPPPVDGNGRLNFQLEPSPDRARTLSEFSGRGLEAGLEARLPILPNGKVWVEAGFAVAAIRGSLRTEYASTTHFFGLDSGSGVVAIEPPFDEFADPNVAGSLVQSSFPVGLKSDERATGLVVDVFGEFRWTAWREMEVFAGFRNTHYDDVAAVVRPQGFTVGLNGALNLQPADRTAGSVEYEGYYFGLAYRF